MDTKSQSISSALTDLSDKKAELQRRTSALRSNVDRLFDQLVDAVQARRRSVQAQISCVEQQMKTEVLQEEAALQRLLAAEGTGARQLSEQLARAQKTMRSVTETAETLDFKANASELCSELLAFGDLNGCPLAAESKDGRCACSVRPRCTGCNSACNSEKAALVSSYFGTEGGSTCARKSPQNVRQFSEANDTLQTLKHIRESPLIYWMPVTVAPKELRDPRVDENLIMLKRLRAVPLDSWLPKRDLLAPVTPRLAALSVSDATPASERSLSISSMSTESEFEEMLDCTTPTC